MKRKPDLQFEEFAFDSLSSETGEYIELPISRKIFLFLAALSALLIFIVLGRIGFLAVGKGDFYKQRSLANVNREVPLPAHRGLILDRYGEVIAKNAETFSVFLNISEIRKRNLDLRELVYKISAALKYPAEEIFRILAEENFEEKTSVAVARNVSNEAAIAVKGLGLEGAVSVENDFRREYVFGEAFSHVIGYTGLAETGSAVVGKTGLELAYDSELRGKDGVYIYYRDALGNVLDKGVLREPAAGRILETTLDAQLQNYFFNRLKQGVQSLGVVSAAGIAIDPNTSEILAMVSIPSFDNNIFVTPGNSEKRVQVINDKSRPLFNRALSGAYNPGSTIKPLVALAALKERLVSADTQILSIGYIEIPNPFDPSRPSRFLDWRPQGLVDVRSALARSSNVYFYAVGGGYENIPGLGIERLKKYWQMFQLGKPTGVDIGPEAVGLLPDPEEKEARTGDIWRIGDTYNVSIGQGDLLVSPLQLINFISSIGNGGKIYQPKIGRRISTEDGTFLSSPKPVLVEDYSDLAYEILQVQAGMEDAVAKDYGTARLLKDLPISVAAKTGTAQTNNNTKENAFFVGYAPAKDPKIAILVLIEDAKQGSLNAVPIAKDIIEWYYYNRISE